LTEVLNPFARTCAILTDGQVRITIYILDCCIGAFIEIVKIVIEFASSKGDCGRDGSIDGGYSF
jgi:hypothetical protein